MQAKILIRREETFVGEMICLKCSHIKIIRIKTVWLSVCLTGRLSVRLCQTVSLYVCLSICHFIFTSDCRSFSLSVCLSICLPVSLPVGLSVCLSVCLFHWLSNYHSFCQSANLSEIISFRYHFFLCIVCLVAYLQKKIKLIYQTFQ